MMPTSATNTIIDVRDLRTEFRTEGGTITAVDGASWSLRNGETLALVGESACGKSVTALSIMGLIPSRTARITNGQILFNDPSTGETHDLTTLPESRMRTIRGRRIAMIFQEPTSALNPVLTIGEQISESVELHRNLTRAQARDIAIDLLNRVGIPAPSHRIRDYPHQLSGGMRQRVMIAIALSCEPAVLIADEPTTALDVTIAAQILDLLQSLQAETGMSILFITHDLGVVARIADRACVMYAGCVVEQAAVTDLFADPLHPYTQALLNSLPHPGPCRQRLNVIPGQVPDPTEFPTGCRFHTRCALTRRRATTTDRPTIAVATGGVTQPILAHCAHPGDDADAPPLREVRTGRHVACWEVDDDGIAGAARP